MIEPILKPPHWRTCLLAYNFPTLSKKVPHIASADGFDAQYLYENSRGLSHGERLAADFVLSVFNSSEWRFDMHEALCTWDAAHREVFLAWAAAPFWE